MPFRWIRLRNIADESSMIPTKHDFMMYFLLPSPNIENKIREMGRSDVSDMSIVFRLYRMEIFGGLGGTHVSKDVI